VATQATPDETLIEALQAVSEYGSKTAAAAALGLSRTTLQSRVASAKLRGLHLSSGIRQSIQTAGLSATEARAGWIVDVDKETGSRTSTYWRTPEPDPTDYAGELAAIFEGMAPAPAVPAPAQTMANLLTLYPLMDVHYGMHAWGAETGSDDYDLKLAASDMHQAFNAVMALTPSSADALLLIGGDFFHADDNRSETPGHGHKLDTDTRHWKVLDGGVQLLATVIQRLLEKHARVMVRVLRGNHDEHAHMVLTFALAERYREDERVTVEKTPRDLFMMQWGRAAIFAHHGDKAKPDRLALYLSDTCPFWSATRHRYCFTGHVHHDQAKDLGPLRWESLRAFCPPDAYAASMGFGARRAMQAITFDKSNGIVLRAIDPIERAAA